MDPNKPVTEERLRLMLGRLFPQLEDWEAIFAPAPEPPQVPVPIPPPTITGQKPLTPEEIAQLREMINSSETGPLTSAEVDTVHAIIAKGKIDGTN
jgi:hypothetical protein